MATYQNTVNDTNISTSLGSPSLSAGDSVEFIKWSIDYVNGGDLSATDLLKVTVGQECECSFQAQLGGQLKITSNRTSTGAFWNRSRSRRIDLLSTSSTGVVYTIHHLGSGPLYTSTLKCAGGYYCEGAGRAYIAADVDVTTIEVSLTGRCTYYKTSGGFAATTINNAGEILIQNDFGTLNNYNGQCVFEDVSVTPTQVNGFGGTIIPRECGTIGGMALKNCTIDWSQMRLPITVSGTTTIGVGMTIRYKKGGLTPTWTTSNTSGDPIIEYV